MLKSIFVSLPSRLPARGWSDSQLSCFYGCDNEPLLKTQMAAVYPLAEDGTGIASARNLVVEVSFQYGVCINFSKSVFEFAR